MIHVPIGQFEMGIRLEDLERICEANFGTPRCLSGDELVVTHHYQVTVYGFWIDKYETTREQYQRCVDRGLCEAVFSTTTQDLQLPVTRINWYQALNYCNSRGARLLTDEEWEYAASGTGNDVLPDGGSILVDFFSELQEPVFEPYIVGSYKADISWIGVYDMGFNVNEWVEDRYAPYPGFEYNPQVEWRADAWRVARDGGWDVGHENAFTFMRSAQPPEAALNIGIRCGRTSDPPE
jgi:formylglycine-generating enzyme required for sulfatase activity